MGICKIILCTSLFVYHSDTDYLNGIISDLDRFISTYYFECSICNIPVNNVGVAYDYPMNFLDITEQVIIFFSPLPPYTPLSFIQLQQIEYFYFHET